MSACYSSIVGLCLAIASIAQTISETDFSRASYEQKLAALNRAIDRVHRRGDGSCPISSLIMTCGDGLCERGVENTENCSADCVEAHVKSFNRQISCERVQSVGLPASIADIKSQIIAARGRGQSIRIIGNRHSANRQYCNDGVVISMEKMNHILGLTNELDGSQSVVVEAGVTFEELAEWLHRRGLSLGYAQLGFRLATIGGAIANGAHGSSHKHSAVISSVVREVTLVTSAGQEILVNDEQPELLRALRAHLGLFGVVATVKLRVAPQFKLRVRITDHADDDLFVAGGLEDAIENCDYSFINWFPSSSRYIKACGKETNDRATRGAENALLNPPVPPGLRLPYKVILHYGMCFNDVNELLEDLRLSLFRWQPPLQKRTFLDNLFRRVTPSDNIVGYSHRVMSSALTADATSFFQNDREIAIPMSRIAPALTALANYIQDHQVHFSLFGVFLRFAPSDDKSLLAHSTSVGPFKNGEPVVFVEIITPEPVGFPIDLKDAVEAPFDHLSRILIEDFHARPHWGKNKDWAFSLARELHLYEDNLVKFRHVLQAIEPSGIFSNEFAQNAGLTSFTPRSRLAQHGK